MLGKFGARFGAVLNIHGEMAHSPALLNGYAALQKAIATHGTFDAATQQAIALAVATANGCDYCQAAHTVLGKQAGLSDEEMLAARSGEAPLPEQLDALLALARAYVAGIGEVSDERWDRALAAGWTDAQLAELAVHITANQLTNHINHYLHTDLDLPAAPPLP